MRKLSSVLTLALAILGSSAAFGLVHYDQGQRIIDGVQLLQDAQDPLVYYYIPQFPRLATKDDGSYELLCLKYIGAGDQASGGLLHALIEFTLPDEVLEQLENSLEREVPGARLGGPVPLMQAVEEGANGGVGSFEVVSAILGDQDGEQAFTRTLVTSGKAPLSPGSKAVVAALLNQEGATLLWDSLTGPTSDVSVSIHAYYEAAVQAYNARVVANVETVYNHFSRIQNQAGGYNKTEMRKVVDDLQRDGTLDIQVLDRTKALGVDAGDLEGILQIVTDKLTELMFNAESGWAKDPEREAAVEAGQIKGRQEPGFLHSLFSSGDDSEYYTDNQYVLKRREDITRNTFTINLSRESTIKVPVDTAGNLGGLYGDLGGDDKYFRIVNLDDPDFEKRTVHFQIDGNFLDSFQDTINSVSVNFRKRYDGDRPDVVRNLVFSHEDVAGGKTIDEITFARLGEADADWTEYEYQVRWSLRDGPTVPVPAREDQWIATADAAISLTPPFSRREVEIEADRQLLTDSGVSTSVVEFAVVLGEEPKMQKRVTLRAGDAESVSRVALYSDRDEPVAYRVSWYSSEGSDKGDLQLLDTDFLFLIPPAGDDDGGSN